MTFLAQLALALPAQADWAPQASSTLNALREVECPSADRCYAVGASGTVVANSGVDAEWQTQSSGTALYLYGLACPSTSTCIAVGDSGVVTKTSNDGASWAVKPSGVTPHLMDISCPGSSVCYAVGHSGTILRSTNNGDTWSKLPSPTTENLYGVSCPTTDLCWAVGNNGTILLGQQQVAGPNWTRQPSGSTAVLDGVSCPTASSCRVTGAGGTILATDTAGVLWSRQTSPTGHYIFDVHCPTTATCWAVGSTGLVLGTVNGGTTWEPEASSTGATLFGVDCVTSSLCKASGDGGTIVTRSGVATGRSSADCDTAANSTGVADGYADDVYVRASTARPGSGRVWVCFRFDNGTSVAQGGLIEIDTEQGVGTPTSDTQADACSTTADNAAPGPHPLVDAAVGDPADPPYLPVKVDTYRNNEAVWVCLRAGTQQHRVRVPLPDVQVPAVTFYPDAPGATPPPDAPPAEPSGTCQAAGGDRVLNMDVATTHIWLYTLRPALNEAKVCVRAQGPLSVGGVLSVRAAVGVPVSVSRSSDTSPCTTEILQSSATPQFRISRTPGLPSTSSPYSVCVDQGGTHERVTVDTTGSLVVPSVTWTPDAGTPGE